MEEEEEQQKMEDEDGRTEQKLLESQTRRRDERNIREKKRWSGAGVRGGYKKRKPEDKETKNEKTN